MPVTRSASKSSLSSARATPTTTTLSKVSEKLKIPQAQKGRKKKNAKEKSEVTDSASAPAAAIVVPESIRALKSQPSFLPAVLSFSIEDAKKHLINVDPRFEDIFGRLKCRPFEDLERVDPFR